MPKLPLRKYGHFFVFFFSILFALIFSQIPLFHQVVSVLNNLGYVGVFIAGILFVSTFTIATATVILLGFLGSFSPLEISIFAGLGATVGNVLVFHLFRHLSRRKLSFLRKLKNKVRRKSKREKHNLHHFFASLVAACFGCNYHGIPSAR